MTFCSVQDAVNLLTLFKYLLVLIVSLLHKTSIDGSIFLLVLLVLFINISKNLVAFVSKAGAKVRGFILIAKRFRKFFFNFSFYIVSQALLRKGKKVKKKNKPRFFANRTAKIRTLFIIIQTFSEVFCSFL